MEGLALVLLYLAIPSLLFSAIKQLLTWRKGVGSKAKFPGPQQFPIVGRVHDLRVQPPRGHVGAHLGCPLVLAVVSLAASSAELGVDGGWSVTSAAETLQFTRMKPFC